MDHQHNPDYPHVSPLYAGLLSRCPRCGKGRLFRGYLALAERCEVCGLDYASADSGDGPAVFIILIAGFIVTGAALLVEVSYQPPLWVHAALWLPVGIGLPLLLLRPFKATLVALQYKFRAEEGRLDN
ncbi:MAG: DUF983 domain-containing protein [Rhodomicrobiaceae bacterium]